MFRILKKQKFNPIIGSIMQREKRLRFVSKQKRCVYDFYAHNRYKISDFDHLSLSLWSIA